MTINTQLLHHAGRYSFFILLVSLFVGACRKPSNDFTPQKKLRVGIIGAGISGLETAKILSEDPQIELEILEPGDHIGGSYHTIHQVFNRFTGEASPLYSLGSGTWNQLINPHKVNTHSQNRDNTLFIDNLGIQSYSEVQNLSAYSDVLKGIRNISSFNGTAAMTGAHYIESQGFDASKYYIFDAETEYLAGNSCQDWSLTANRHESVERVSQGVYLADPSLHAENLFYSRYKALFTQIRHNTRVTQIDYNTDGVIVTDRNQNIYEYDVLIITIPLGSLKRKESEEGYIQFLPELSKEKRNAIAGIEFEQSARIFLHCNERFWPEGTETIYMDSKYSRWEIKDSDRNGHFLLVCDIYGEKASALLNGLREDEILNELRKEWTALAGAKVGNTIEAIQVLNKNNSEYGYGGFSSLKTDGDEALRAILATPVEGKLYFAGEACVQGIHAGTAEAEFISARTTAAQILAKKK